MTHPADATFIDSTQIGCAGTAVAVKDLIDLAGLPSTAGCRAIARAAVPAGADAACMAGLRAAIDAARRGSSARPTSPSWRWERAA